MNEKKIKQEARSDFIVRYVMISMAIVRRFFIYVAFLSQCYPSQNGGCLCFIV